MRIHIALTGGLAVVGLNTPSPNLSAGPLELAKFYGLANSNTRDSIKTNHYDSITQWLKPPTHEIDFNIEADQDGKHSRTNLLETDLVYVCGNRDHRPCSDPNVVATCSGESTRAASLFESTVVLLCPLFFSIGNFNLLKQTWQENSVLDTDSASTLLHEMQHNGRVTGFDRRAIDVPTQPPQGCYIPEGYEFSIKI